MKVPDPNGDGPSRRTVVKHGLPIWASFALGGATAAGTADSRRVVTSGAPAVADGPPAVVWAQRVGSHRNLVVAEYASAIVTAGAGTVLAGMATGPPDPDGDHPAEFWLQRRDGTGDVVWSSLYDGEDSVVTDLVRAGLRRTGTTGGYAVVGSVGGGDRSDPGGPGADARIVKTEGWSDGDGFNGPATDWEWTDDGDADSGFTAVTADQSGVAAAGTKDDVPAIVAFDGDGTVRWAETYDVFEFDERASVETLLGTDDGNLAMLVADVPACSSQSIEVVIADGTDGERIDSWSYDTHALRDAVRTHEGYALAGWTDATEGNEDFLLTSADGNGDRLWTETYGGPTEGDADLATDLVRTGDGYVLGGERVQAEDDERSAQLVHTDRDGEEQWATVIHDDTEAQQYTAATVIDGYVYVLGAVREGDTDASDKQITLWKLAADDVLAPDRRFR